MTHEFLYASCGAQENGARDLDQHDEYERVARVPDLESLVGKKEYDLVTT